ncbi:hypothetical protein [Chamaesiphon sp. GL140_3_metabinner_50]|uniref:hypothetical protein n=1 Tax=Chamaesiphon sp. GL140_3_metabinner_50 TaxID=2970812 RepID=UPI0025D13B57|nr:hypothetical protein [Chamaesiphon sp. GL140_3_metabinner_50]
MSHTFSKQQKLVAIKGNGCKLIAIDFSLDSCLTIVVVLMSDRSFARIGRLLPSNPAFKSKATKKVGFDPLLVIYYSKKHKGKLNI